MSANLLCCICGAGDSVEKSRPYYSFLNYWVVCNTCGFETPECADPISAKDIFIGLIGFSHDRFQQHWEKYNSREGIIPFQDKQTKLAALHSFVAAELGATP